MGFIDGERVLGLASELRNNDYGQYLRRVVEEDGLAS